MYHGWIVFSNEKLLCLCAILTHNTYLCHAVQHTKVIVLVLVSVPCFDDTRIKNTVVDLAVRGKVAKLVNVVEAPASAIYKLRELVNFCHLKFLVRVWISEKRFVAVFCVK
jgi:hypothetical protein